MGFEKDVVPAQSKLPERPPSASAGYAFRRRGGDHSVVSRDPSTEEIALWSVGAARVIYWLKQLPALILLTIAAWILIGYQIFIAIPKSKIDEDEITSPQSCVLDAAPLSLFEYVTAGGAAAAAAAAIIGALRGCCQKLANPGAAKAHSVWRLFFAILCIGFAAPTIVFAVLVMIKIREAVPHAVLFNMFPLECFTLTGRLMLNSCILAGATVLFVLSLFSFSFCIVALVTLSKARREARFTRASKFFYLHNIGVCDTPTDRY